MDKQRVILEIENDIAFVTLNRAKKRNALDMAMFSAIDRVSRQLRRNREIRAVIVMANGEDFCSGLDIKSVMRQRSSVLALLAKWFPGKANLAQRVSYNWRKIPVPVIMVIQGRCWGGGLQIALGADFRFASTDATFSIMEGKWGLIPDMGGTLALRELMDRDKAMKLAMTAEEISGTEAFELRLASGLDSDPSEVARALAERPKERSPDAIAACHSP